jgi:hypothetical protein
MSRGGYLPMNKHLFRFLFALLFAILLCGAVQATNLQITVQDSLDNVTISQATVYLDGANLGKTTNAGTYYITHSGLNDLKLRISKSGYDDWENTVGMNVTAALVNLTRKSLILKVTLYDVDSLQAVPSADVKITNGNTSETKKTDSNGSTSYAVKAYNSYDLSITAPYYQSYVPPPLDIGTENKDVQYWLMRNDRFSFVVTDKSRIPISDAELYIDSTLKGKTDARGIIILALEREKPYAIEVKKSGYQSFIERKTIGLNEAIVAIQISKVPVGAFVSVFDEKRGAVEEASVYLDTALIGNTDQYGRYVFGSIVSGTYQLEVRKEGYVTVKKQITVTKQGDDFTIELPFEQVDLTIFVKDKDQKVIPGVMIELNSKTLGSTDENGQIITKLKFNTPYNISAVKEGYQPASFQKSIILGNSSATVTLIMEKNLDWAFISLVLIGATGILVVFALIRRLSHKARRHVIRRNEI